MSYNAVVARIRVSKHPNADRLQLGNVLGNQVIVGLETKEGELGVYFGPDGQLSPEMCAANDLIGVYTNGKKVSGGFFSESRRVRAQNFRGVKSDGFWMPLSALFWTGADVTTLREGDTFTELNGHEVCRKYYTPATLKAMANTARKVIRDNPMFAKHVDTPQFRQLAGTIPEGSICYLTEKLHGTSGRFGHVLVPQPKTLWQKFRSWWERKDVYTLKWDHLNGSRNVVLEESKEAGDFYGTHGFREMAVAGLTLHKGEVLYFELVGYTETGQPIMSPQPNKIKELAEIYGPTMTYKYGQPVGTCGLYVYRITRVNEDGQAIDLSWPQVRGRCRELGLETVPELRTGPFFCYDANTVARLMDHTVVGPSTLDPTHIREGLVLRVETPDGQIFWLKHKSFEFGVLEGYIKDSDTYVDTEEVA